MLETIQIDTLKDIAFQAGKAVMKIYQNSFEVQYKQDNSPLTQADIVANDIICRSLQRLYPNIPILSEENETIAFAQRKNWEYYWCIDPIDGTKEFIQKNGEFTVNIALVYKNTPVLGVVYAPALHDMYYAKQHQGAYKEVLSAEGEVLTQKRLPLFSQKNLQNEITVVASKSHLSHETQEFIDKLAQSSSSITLISKGSSLKLCMIATGEADIYPRLCATMEWDIAAADAIVQEAGKNVFIYNPSQKSNVALVAYNKANLLNPWFLCTSKNILETI